MSIAEGIIQVIEEQARVQAFSKVNAVWLEIGPLASVEKEALSFCFDAVTRHTLAEGARLQIIDLPGQAWCLGCSQTVAVTQRFDSCPHCGGYQLQVTAGDELRIKELEVV
ncbi:hydrogenase maturation nickel metallochaperone HypA [Oceanobacter mangrovi]|uniref:hydrogenase maturation nickel metallochaperone HypA n=1 Tax=Oceanobacter mangrovi TaxID=2862510 RepID=UPI001FECBA82|nr:hydrogenase maturation nickel metallochaperone HypA [Oceanobacter mangrovi]